MRDKPIIFSAPMVRALMDGRKTQTRRLLTSRFGPPYERADDLDCVRFEIGDRLYVREAHYLTDDGDNEQAVYAADADDVAAHLAEVSNLQRRYPQIDWSKHLRLRPSIHMPRWASRLTLTVTDVLVQRLQEISGQDSIAEGVECDTCTAMKSSACHGKGCFASKDAYRNLWNSLHGPDAWAANPWVVAVSFTVQRGNIDQIGGPHD